MTVAHEFAHAKLHSNILSTLKNDAAIEGLHQHFTANPNLYSDFEIQAFTLAGYLLVPDETLLNTTREVVAFMERKLGKPLTMTSEVVWKIIARDVARRYEVTPQVTAKRLEWSGIWKKPLPSRTQA